MLCYIGYRYRLIHIRDSKAACDYFPLRFLWNAREHAVSKTQGKRKWIDQRVEFVCVRRNQPIFDM